MLSLLTNDNSAFLNLILGKILTISNHEPKPPPPSASRTKSTVSGTDLDSTILMLSDEANSKAKPPLSDGANSKAKPPPPSASKTKSILSDTDLDSTILTLSDEANSKAAEKTTKTDDSQDSSVLSESS